MNAKMLTALYTLTCGFRIEASDPQIVNSDQLGLKNEEGERQPQNPNFANKIVSRAGVSDDEAAGSDKVSRRAQSKI